jgi:hypothetical protein
MPATIIDHHPLSRVTYSLGATIISLRKKGAQLGAPAYSPPYIRNLQHAIPKKRLKGNAPA